MSSNNPFVGCSDNLGLSLRITSLSLPALLALLLLVIELCEFYFIIKLY